MSNKQKVIDALLASGCVEKPGASKKYRVFDLEAAGDRYIVGRAGGLRRCRIGKPISRSVSLTHSILQAHLASGKTLQSWRREKIGLALEE